MQDIQFSRETKLMPRITKKPSLSPAVIMDDLMGAWRSRALVAAVELDVFTHIAAGKRTVKEVAEAAGASQRGIANLLDALVAMHYLRKSGNRYGLQPVSATFLVRDGKTYMGGSAEPFALTWKVWEHLAETVRTGRPREAINDAEIGKEFFPRLVASIFPGSFSASTAVVAQFSGKDRRAIRKILDVAAGSGAWSLAFAQALPEARVTTVDFPEMTPITRKFAEQFGVADRYDYQEGNLQQLDFGRDIYDLVILGHIIHSEGEKHGKELLQKAYAALRRGGKLLIAEFIPNDTRTGPTMPVLFGLNMLVHTEEGNVFTLREYRAWLKAAGFGKVTTVPVPPPATVIIATK
jgi:2-polyprenyl-3-methyl-5-hydroxy-6-metoxy-1,4-benzoquinol methylase